MTYESFTVLIGAVDASLKRIVNSLRLSDLPDQTAHKTDAEIYAIRNILSSIDLIAKTEGVDQHYEV